MVKRFEGLVIKVVNRIVFFVFFYELDEHLPYGENPCEYY